MDFLKLLGFYIVIPMVTDTAYTKNLDAQDMESNFFFHF